MNNDEKTVEECRMQKLEDKMVTFKTSRTILAEFGDKKKFRKNFENPLKYLEAKFLTDGHKILKAASKPTCKGVISNDNYAI